MKQFLVVLGIALLIAIWFVYVYRKNKEESYKLIRRRWGKLANREYSLEEYEKLSHFYKRVSKRDGRFHIDDQTWKDMGMDHFYQRLNNCGSPAGEEYLYYILRTPDLDGRRTRQLLEQSKYFMKHKQERLRVQASFSFMNGKKRVAFADFLEVLDHVHEESAVLDITAMIAFFVGLILFLFEPKEGLLALIFILMFNIFTYIRKKSRTEAAFESIVMIIDLVINSRHILHELPKNEEFSTINSMMRQSLFKMKKHIRFGWLISYKQYNGSFVEVIADYICYATHLDLIVYDFMTHDIKKVLKDVEFLFKAVGSLETALCLASYRTYLYRNGGYCIPYLLGTKDERGFLAQEIRHPLLKEPVSNSLVTDKSVLITGSNASGKSTFLRTVGINMIMAQTLGIAAAKNMIFPYCRLFSSMQIEDNIEKKESYFMAESRMLKRILQAAEGEIPVTAILDEVLRGTNTVERIAASSKILANLTSKNVLCFAATHDLELTHLLSAKYENYHFDEELHDNDIIFSYKLKKGQATSRNAMKLLKVMGYDESVIDASEHMADHFIACGKWELL